ncbi:MAG: glycosyltransferase family 4 protein [Chitinophagaceae bacterium]|nr:glycosyltransferase family 4 protein [Chitinophagaceae bacterium]
MNFIFVSTGSYPDVHAAAIRQSVLAKGLVELGHGVRFLVLTPQDWAGKKKLDYFGVQFEELNSYKGSNKILKHYYYLKSVLKTKKILKQQATEKKIDAMMVFSIMSIHTIPIDYLVKKAKSYKIKVFHERTELPYVFDINKRMLHIYQHKMLPRFDGIFVISDKLITYLKQFNPALKKLLTVVDLAFFSTTKPSPYPFPYVGYCGNISGNKDGVPVLIEAFAKIKDRFPDLKLVLVGNNNNKTAIKETLDAISRLGITDRVVFTGLVEREMMPVILCNASILVVAKPDNELNSGNFPIKIGEYLATGVPIVVTSVGEIPLFVKDGETGFLSVPDNADAFAIKMEEALADPERSKAIGLAGKKVAQTLFDYKIQAGIMADYIAEQIKQQ